MLFDLEVQTFMNETIYVLFRCYMLLVVSKKRSNYLSNQKLTFETKQLSEDSSLLLKICSGYSLG